MTSRNRLDPQIPRARPDSAFNDSGESANLNYPDQRGFVMPKMQPAFAPNDITENMMLQQLGAIHGLLEKIYELMQNQAGDRP